MLWQLGSICGESKRIIYNNIDVRLTLKIDIQSLFPYNLPLVANQCIARISDLYLPVLKTLTLRHLFHQLL